MTYPYYVPKLYYQNNNPFDINNSRNYQKKPKEEIIELVDSDEENLKEKDNKNAKDKNEDNDSDEEEDENSSLDSINIFNNDNNDNNNDNKNTINNNNNSYIFKPTQNNINKPYYRLTKEHNFNNNRNIINAVIKPNNVFQNKNNYNINNKNTINIMFTKKDNNKIKHVDKINEKKITFEESMARLKKNYNSLFATSNSECPNVFENEQFRKHFTNNKNMKLIFDYHDIIKELYENKIETKIIEKACDINKIIDNYINKMRKLGKKRNIVIKDYKNYLYVIGVEMMVNKKDKLAKEFIVKKITETYKGNYKIDTQDDDCYFIEVNNTNKTKQIYKTISNVTISLTMLLQSMYNDAVSK